MLWAGNTPHSRQASVGSLLYILYEYVLSLMECRLWVSIYTREKEYAMK